MMARALLTNRPRKPHDLSELASLPSLTSLDLSDNPLGDEGCAALCTALLDAHLSTLVLDDCSIGCDASSR